MVFIYRSGRKIKPVTMRRTFIIPVLTLLFAFPGKGQDNPDPVNPDSLLTVSGADAETGQGLQKAIASSSSLV